MTEGELKHRIKNALVLLREGHTFRVGGLTFGCQDKDHFSVTGWTVQNDLKNITKEAAVAELTEIKEIFSKMIYASEELADFVKERQIEYRLGFDYGMGALELCREMNGHLHWTIELKD